MTELRAILLALLRADWNLGWRFSRAKWLLWRTLLAFGFGALVAWRTPALPLLSPGYLPLSSVALQAGLIALLTGFMRGREQLFEHRFAALFHLSPAPSWAVLGGRLLATLPGRLLAASLLTWINLRLLPVETPWLWAPLAVLTGLISSLLGQLAGNLGLIGWARLSPRTVGIANLLGLLIAVSLAWGVIGLLAVGAPIDDLVALIYRLRSILLTLYGLIILLPGLALGLLLLLRPAWVGDLYRSAYMAISESGEAALRPRRSWLPRPYGSPLWAIGMKELRQLSRNWLNYWRLFGPILLLWALPFLRGPAREWAYGHPTLVALILGVGGTWVAFVEMIAALFAADEERAELFITSGLRPWEYLGGKLIGTLPLALIAGLSTGAAGWLLGGSALALGGLGALLFLGLVGAILGPSAAGFNARSSPWNEIGATGLNLREQVPSDLGGWIGFLLSGLLGAGALLFVGILGAPTLALLGALGVGLLALTASLPRLRRLLLRGRAE